MTNPIHLIVMLLPLTITVLYVNHYYFPIEESDAATTTFTDNNNNNSNNETRTFQSNATGDTITFQNGKNASATSFKPGITGFGPTNPLSVELFLKATQELYPSVD